MGKNLIMRLAAAAAGGTLALAAAAPALAQAEDTIPINPGNVPTTAEGFGNHEGCDNPTDPLFGLEDDQDGWHFVLPQGPGDNALVSITLMFEMPGPGEPVLIESTDPENPSTGNGWSGYIDPDLGTGLMHAWLVTDAGWRLVDGNAVVTDPSDAEQFNLSHTCPGTPGDGNGGKPSPSPTPSPPGEDGDNGQGGEDGDDDQLPVTGLQAGGLVVLGAGLLAAGGAMLFVRRRRSLAGLVDGSDG